MTKYESSSGLDYNELRRILSYNRTTGIFTWRLAVRVGWKGRRAGNLYNNGYRIISYRGYRFAEHRLAWLYVTGLWPKIQIDHRDRNKSNNAFNNLREATGSEQRANVENRKSKSGFRGVSYCKIPVGLRNKWMASIELSNRHICLGLFSTAIEAAKAYDDTAKATWGEFYTRQVV